MGSVTTAELEQVFVQIEASYDEGFAGKQRATRDLGELDGLLGRLRELIKKIEAMGSSAPSEFLEKVRARLATCESEREAIKAAQEGGPDAVEFSRYAAFANFVFARYLRHFAGQPRDSRDLGLLKEMLDELRTLRQRMKTIASAHPQANYKHDVELVANRIEQYETEMREVEKAQSNGTPEEMAGKLANLANLQFELYQTHFLGHSRLTRRPALLQRMIENLRRFRAAMKNVRLSGQAGENNRGNITVVDDALKHYEAELGEIRKARQANTLSDLMSLLGGAANDVFNDYRQKFAGKDRRSVDPGVLSLLCDRLGEISRQMAEMGRTERNEMNDSNLDIVIEQLGMYEDEWKAINQVKKPQA